MAAESILTYKKPGFPKKAVSEKSYRTTIEYVGAESTLVAAAPGINEAWGDYVGIVVSTDVSPIEGTSQAELTVVVEYNFDGSSAGSGTAREIVLEVEWVAFQRPMLEHPEFRKGGGGTYELDELDIADIEEWRNAPPSLKGVYKYYDTNTESENTLGTNAEKFCNAIELGLETYEDFAPVIRKTTTYAGGMPGTSDAGAKDASSPSFTGKPTGYEWRKSADRSVRGSGQTRWDRIEEWIGAIKVLVDKSDIYF